MTLLMANMRQYQWYDFFRKVRDVTRRICQVRLLNGLHSEVDQDAGDVSLQGTLQL